MTRAGSVRAVRQAIRDELEQGEGGGERRRLSAPSPSPTLRSVPDGSPSAIRSRRVRARRRRIRRAAGRGRTGRDPVPSRRWRPTARTVPFGASKSISVNPAAAKSARTAGVRSGGRRCRVHSTWPPGTQKPRHRLDGARDVRRADVPEHPAHQDDVGRHGAGIGIGCGTARRRPRPTRIRSATPAPAAAARARAKAARAGSSSTSSAETSGPLGWVATTSITSRPWPAHRLTIRMGSPGSCSRYRPDRPGSRTAGRRRLGPGTSSSAARTMDCTARNRCDSPTTDPRRTHATAPSANRSVARPVRATVRPRTRPRPGWSPGAMTAHRRVVRRDRPDDQIPRFQAPPRPRPHPDLPGLRRPHRPRSLHRHHPRRPGLQGPGRPRHRRRQRPLCAHLRPHLHRDRRRRHRRRRARRRPSPTSTPSPANRATSPRPSAIRPASSNRTTPLG